jgi:hypothetical protein
MNGIEKEVEPMTMRLKNHRKTASRKSAARTTVANNTTAYGHLIYRTPVTKNEFVGHQGTKPEAIILDIDGTLQDWGSGLSKQIADWLKGHYDKGRVLIVITARTHQHDYQRSFDWLMRNVPYPFIGPFCRAKDDPRYASEFKKETIEALGQIYEVVGAAEDNKYVLDMYRHWAQDKPDFDLLECGYTPYTDWRKDLPTKGYTYTGKYGTSYVSSLGTTEAKHRPAGSSRWDEGWDSYDMWEGHTRDDDAPVTTAVSNDRIALEDEVLAQYTSLGLDEVEELDSEVLRQMLLDTEQPETAPLDVAEIFSELGEQPFTQQEVAS